MLGKALSAFTLFAATCQGGGDYTGDGSEIDLETSTDRYALLTGSGTHYESGRDGVNWWG